MSQRYCSSYIYTYEGSKTEFSLRRNDQMITQRGFGC